MMETFRSAYDFDRGRTMPAIRIGMWLANPEDGTLTPCGEGDIVRLEPRVMSVLVFLAEHLAQSDLINRFAADREAGRLVVARLSETLAVIDSRFNEFLTESGGRVPDPPGWPGPPAR